MSNVQIPVKYKDVIVGYTENGGKYITFFDTEEARECRAAILNGQPIGISSRSIGRVDENNLIVEEQKFEYSFMDREEDPKDCFHEPIADGMLYRCAVCGKIL